LAPCERNGWGLDLFQKRSNSPADLIIEVISESNHAYYIETYARFGMIERQLANQRGDDQHLSADSGRLRLVSGQVPLGGGMH
jgi:hypothetical protein